MVDVDRRPAPARVGLIPGVASFGPTVERFDEWADAQLELIRGNPLADALFTGATKLGDFSVIWHLTNVVRGTTGKGRFEQIPVLALLIGAESLIVNQGLKRVFNRKRPTVEGDPRYHVRRPSTSSFPSGHASAAGFTATVLTGWDGHRSKPLWWTMAGIVATSRAYVRIHHASDVVAGVAVGSGLGWMARQMLRRCGRT